MSAERISYLDASAIVKLAVKESESASLRRYLRRRRPYVSSALARTEVARALLPLGPAAQQRGRDVLARIELVRVSDRILTLARRTRLRRDDRRGGGAHALPLYTCNPGWLGASWPETAVNYVRGGPGVDACARPEWSQDTLRDCEVFPEMVPW